MGVLELRAGHLTEMFSYVSFTFIYLLEAVLQAIDPSCLATTCLRKKNTTDMCLAYAQTLMVVNLLLMKTINVLIIARHHENLPVPGVLTTNPACHLKFLQPSRTFKSVEKHYSSM